jgi:putative chitinase
MIDITANNIRALAKHAKPRIVSGIVVNQEAIRDGGINTPLRLGHFMAQLAYESAHFQTTREFGSGEAYEGRKDLGNTQRGDGPRYRGRGLIPITGRANYRWVTTAIRMIDPTAPDFEAEPAKLEDFPWALFAGIAYWQRKNANAAADRDDLSRVSRLLDGAAYGLDNRIQYLNKAKKIWMEDARATIFVHGREVHPHMPTLREGSDGPHVIALQKALTGAGFKVAPDGAFGKNTKAAVKAFQVHRGLEADGVIGSSDWHNLDDVAGGVGGDIFSNIGSTTIISGDDLPGILIGSADDSRVAEGNEDSVIGAGGAIIPPPDGGTEKRTDDPAPESTPGEPPSFFFKLEGTDQDGKAVVGGDEALWGTEFDLLFNYGQVTAGALAVLKQTKLEQVTSGELALGVEVVPRGLTLTKGSVFRLVKFKDGAMEPVRFSLKAPQQDGAEDEPYGAYVTFTAMGAIVYSFFLDIRLVEKLSDAPHAGQRIDLDARQVAANKDAEARVAAFTIERRGGPWRVTGGVFGAEDDIRSEDTVEINEGSLKGFYEKSIAEPIQTVAAETAWQFVCKNLELPEEHDNAALSCLQQVMKIGSDLYQHFMREKKFKEIIDRIEVLPPNSRITVKTDSEAFPWEFFYPLPYDDEVDSKKNFYPEKFWGHRFLFETLLLPPSNGQKFPPLRRQRGKLHVSMGMNSGIDTEVPWNADPPRPVQIQKEFFDAALKDSGTYFDQYDDIRSIVLKDDPASLIYLFCHGAAEELKFDDVSPRLKPKHLTGGPQYPNWPVVFINACDAGNISPFASVSFRTEFRLRGAAGIIAPLFEVPTMFAARFANAFLRAYSDRQSVGATLLTLRRELLARNNPLGLWYSLQCPLDVKASGRP